MQYSTPGQAFYVLTVKSNSSTVRVMAEGEQSVQQQVEEVGARFFRGEATLAEYKALLNKFVPSGKAFEQDLHKVRGAVRERARNIDEARRRGILPPLPRNG